MSEITCNNCKQALPIEAFSSRKEGRRKMCKDCMYLVRKTYRENPEVKARRDLLDIEYRARPEVKMSISLAGKKHEAKRRIKGRSFSDRYKRVLKAHRERFGTESDLTLEQYTKLATQPCYYCEQPLTETVGSSLDRMDNSRGYTSDNVLPCCCVCNRFRNAYLSVDEMVYVSALLKTLRGSDDMWANFEFNKKSKVQLKAARPFKWPPNLESRSGQETEFQC